MNYFLIKAKIKLKALHNETLTKNNNREWFNNNKNQYLEAKEIFEKFIIKLIEQISTFDTSLEGIQAKDCIFRIYRDVRFSKDKKPYKNHFGAYISNGGRKSNFAGYYIHISNTESFLGGGLHSPEPTILKKIREDIDYDSSTLRQIISNKKFKNTYNSLIGEKLKVAPKGYPKTHIDIDLLRHKEFTAIKTINTNIITDVNFINFASQQFEVLKPLLDYLNKAILFD